jgi:hypothetical protein
MNMFDELKAWADKWGVPYQIAGDDKHKEISFDSITYYDATLSYNANTGDYTWYGGD